MPKLIIVTRDGATTEVEGAAGVSVMQLIRDAGFDELLALCGGSCSCATCHVYADSADGTQLPLLSDEEDELLDSSQFRQPNSRLSCQLKFGEQLGGLRVTIAPED